MARASAYPRDPVHDPGPRAARLRANLVPITEATIVRPRRAAPIRVGTASWTDPTLTARGVFYPPDASSAEARLRYYASRFPIVEADSPFYGLPVRRTAELWARRTPDDFIFNVKAYALMTGHPSEVARLPKDLRKELPRKLREKRRIYGKDLPRELHDAVWEWFVDALQPLHSAGKLGAVLLQYPRWFMPNRVNRAQLLDACRRLGDLEVAVEFRNRRWFGERDRERTLEFLSRHEIPYVMVDEPQGFESSVPPIPAVTSPRLAMLRMHGRREETWEKRDVGPSERFRYLYTREELEQWAANVLDAARQAREVHVIQNNCHGNYGTTNALEFTYLLLEEAGQAMPRARTATAARAAPARRKRRTAAKSSRA